MPTQPGLRSLQGQRLVAEVLHTYQGFLLVLERRFFDQLWLTAAAVDQGVVVIGGELDRYGLATDLGAVVTARHKAEIAAGQWRLRNLNKPVRANKTWL